MTLRFADRRDCEGLAQIHARAFQSCWSATELCGLLATPGTFAIAAENDGALVAFVMGRVAADEAEILTLAVDPAKRRRGLGAALVDAAASAATCAGARRLFLEVARENAVAMSLYRRAGFVVVGERAGYYGNGGSDAVVLRLELKA